MKYKTYVRLVYAHSECIGTHHYTYIATNPGLLFAASFLAAKAGMIEIAAYAFCPQKRSYLFAAAAASGIDYAAAGMRLAVIQDFSPLVGGRAAAVGEVGPLEISANKLLFLEFKPLHYILAYFGGGCGREGYHWGFYIFPQGGYLQITGPEIITPLADAMGFVHYYIIDIQGAYPLSEKIRVQAFGAEIQELEISVCTVVQGCLNFTATHSAMYCKGLDTSPHQAFHLVFHQSYERGNHNSETFAQHGRNLKTYGFAAACRQYS